MRCSHVPLMALARVVGLLASIVAAVLPWSASAQPDLVAPPRRSAGELLRRLVRLGLRTPYEGEQVTQTFGPRVMETHQIVKSAGPARQRVEYTQPPGLKGEIILIAGARLLHYFPRPSPHVIEVGLAHDRQNPVGQLFEGVQRGRIQVAVAGRQVIAGRAATILEIRARAGAPFRRVWLDEATGVRLRHESVAGDGRVLAASYFTRISFRPSFDRRDFRPDSLPSAPLDLLVPTTPPLDGPEAAQRSAGFAVKVPAVPAGYSLEGTWVAGRRGSRSVLLRFTDGVNSFFLNERPVPPGLRAGLHARLGRAGILRPGLLIWASGDRIFTLYGDLRPDLVRIVRRSLE